VIEGTERLAEASTEPEASEDGVGNPAGNPVGDLAENPAGDRRETFGATEIATVEATGATAVDAIGTVTSAVHATEVTKATEDVTVQSSGTPAKATSGADDEPETRYSQEELDRMSIDDFDESGTWTWKEGKVRKNKKDYLAAVLDLSTTAEAGTFANGIVSPAEIRHIRKMNAYKVDPGLNKKDTVIERNSGSYSIPVSIGIGAKIRLSKRFDLGIGLNYTIMSRKLAGEFNGEYYSEIRNIQQYIGIPVNLYYNIIGNDKISLYIQAGGAVERGISDLYRMTGADNSVITHHEPVKGVQFSVSAGIGIEYWFSSVAGVYFDPTIRYYFDNYQAKSIRTDQPLQTGFEIGVRFRF
ncbi:MAG: PorT family protein, partial [Muribaculum sp.]|nr:PorT family protein [Candidatus Merdivivens faecigallinarum]